MGHDIYAIRDINEYYKFWDTSPFNFSGEDIKRFRKRSEIVYLRRSMNCTSIKTFYLYLGCDNFYAGCSGNGESVWVSFDTLKNALEKFEENKNLFETPDLSEDYGDYTDFIHKCIVYCTKTKNQGVIIRFA